VRTYLENTLHQQRARGVARGEGLVFKSQYYKKKKKVKLKAEEDAEVKKSNRSPASGFSS
jgi:hypothetical protein